MKKLLLIGVLVLVAGCNGDDNGGVYIPPEPIPCEDVYWSRYNQYVEDVCSYHTGIAYLYCLLDALHEAKHSAQWCCQNRYSGEEYEECMSHWTRGSSGTSITCVPENGSVIDTEQKIYILLAEDYEFDPESLVLGGSMIEYTVHGIKWHAYDPWNYGIKNNVLEIYPSPEWLTGEVMLVIQVDDVLEFLEYTVVEE